MWAIRQAAWCTLAPRMAPQPACGGAGRWGRGHGVFATLQVSKRYYAHATLYRRVAVLHVLLLPLLPHSTCWWYGKMI